jgi:hypothetical protein
LSITDLGIDGDIFEAFNQWTQANQSNGTNIGFSYATGGGPFPVYAEQLNVQGDGVPADTSRDLLEGTQTLVAAYTTFYYNTTGRGGGLNIDPNSAGYHAAITKIMLHGIGHTMGLENQPTDFNNPNCAGQVAGESVMNAVCGTNDSANNMPSSVTSCDNASAHSDN